MRKKTKNIAFLALIFTFVYALFSAVQLQNGYEKVFAESTSYVTSLATPVVYTIEDYVALNAEGINVKTTGKGEARKSWQISGLWQDNCELRAGISVSNNKSNVSDLRIYFGGNSPWNTYALLLNYPQGKLTFKAEGNKSEEKRSQIIAEHLALAYGTDYKLELSYTKLLSTADGSYCGDRFDLRFYDEKKQIDITWNSVFLGEERCAESWDWDNKMQPAFGMYMYNEVDFYLKAYDFQREYFVLVQDGNKRVPYMISYGQEYDFSDYIPDKAGYIKKGFKTVVGNNVLTAPISGRWTTDITETTGGKYQATFTPYYEPINYPVTYSYDTGKATLPNGALQTVNADNVTAALPVLNITASGYVFLGWYKDSAYTQKITAYECAEGGFTLYGKIARGNTLKLIYPNGETQSVAVEQGESYTFPSPQITGYQPVSKWERRSGDTWVSAENTVTPTENGEYRAVADKLRYTIVYDLNGGENNAGNVSEFTVEDEITLKAPAKEGYFFDGFKNEKGERVGKIFRGTSENIKLTATYVKDTFVESVTYIQSQTAALLPLYTVPETAETLISVFKGEMPVGISEGKAVFNETGDYTVAYDITLIGGETVQKIVNVRVIAPTIVTGGEYRATYSAGEKIELIDASCDDTTQSVLIKVLKDGKEIAYQDFSLTAEEGAYTVKYYLQSGMAQEIERTFTVEKAEKSGCASSKVVRNTIIVTVIIVALAVSATVIINKKLKERKK